MSELLEREMKAQEERVSSVLHWKQKQPSALYKVQLPFYFGVELVYFSVPAKFFTFSAVLMGTVNLNIYNSRCTYLWQYFSSHSLSYSSLSSALKFHCHMRRNLWEQVSRCIKKLMHYSVATFRIVLGSFLYLYLGFQLIHSKGSRLFNVVLMSLPSSWASCFG